MKRKRLWCRTTIKEAYPVFPDRPGDGPFYAPGSEWFDFPQARQHRERCAAELRRKGFTVTVDLVERPE